MTIVSLVVLVSANVLLKLSARAKSILLIPTSASSVALVQMFVLLKLSAWVNPIGTLQQKRRGCVNMPSSHFLEADDADDTDLFFFFSPEWLIIYPCHPRHPYLKS
jgi:hypothetical protein